MEKRKGRITAGELQAQLAQDPEFQARAKERQRKFEERGRMLDENQKPLVEDLNAHGAGIQSVYDLVNTAASYPSLISVLIKHLPIEYHERIKEGIVRALTVKEAKGIATQPLIEEYNRTPKENSSLRWCFGNAVNITVTAKDIESIIPIVQDKENGQSRHMFIKALRKFRTERVESVLIRLLGDPEVAIYAIESLSHMKSRKALEKIRPFASSPKKEVQKAALKAVKRIEGA